MKPPIPEPHAGLPVTRKPSRAAWWAVAAVLALYCLALLLWPRVEAWRVAGKANVFVKK